MATPQAHSDSEVLGSILNEFHFAISPAPFPERQIGGGYGPTKKVGAAGLNSRHPAFGVIGKQIDAAAVLVRRIEDFLNKPGTFCVPAHWDIGLFQFWPGDGMANYGTPFGSSRVLDHHTQYSLAVVRSNDKWRVVVYRWTIFGVERNDRRGRSKPSRKPWLEASYMDKAVTLSSLPKLFDKLLKQVDLLVRVASTNEESLTALGDIVKSLPTQ